MYVPMSLNLTQASTDIKFERTFRACQLQLMWIAEEYNHKVSRGEVYFTQPNTTLYSHIPLNFMGHPTVVSVLESFEEANLTASILTSHRGAKTRKSFFLSLGVRLPMEQRLVSCCGTTELKGFSWVGTTRRHYWQSAGRSRDCRPGGAAAELATQ